MLLLFYLTVSLSSIEAWVLHPAPCCGHRLRHISTARATTITAGTTTRIVALSAESNTDGSNSKKKRRRKAPPTESTPGKNSAKEGAGQRVEQMAIEMNDDDNDDNLERTSFSLSKDDLLTMTEIARFEFKGDKDSSMRTPLVPMPNDPTKGATGSKDTAAWSMDDPTFDNSIDSDKSSDVLPLPDIKEARKKKQMEEEMARMDQENEEQKVRIKRTDKEAFRRVCPTTLKGPFTNFTTAN